MFRRVPPPYLACLLALLTVTATAAPPPASAPAAGSPEDVLKTNGLKKVGLFYLLEADINLPEWVRATRAREKDVEQATRQRTNLEKDLTAAIATLNDLDAQNRDETARLEKMSKEAFGSYNHQVDKVNSIRAKMRDGVAFVEKRRKALAEVRDPTDEYVAMVLKQADMMEATAARYAALAADESVRGALDRLNQSAAPTAKVRLGPSERFTTELATTRKLRDTVNAASITFDYVGGVPQVPVTINGSVTIDMVVDSGAALVTLTPETANKLGLAPAADDRTVKLVSADGKVTEAHLKTLKSVRLGKFTIENVECAIQPPNIKGASDLLGGTFLRHFVYRMDLAAGVLKLSQATASPAAAAGPGSPPIPTKPPPPKPAGPAVQIVSARWGGGNNWSDVTAKLKALLAGADDIWANPNTLGADPTPGWKKRLEITYTVDGETKSVTVAEDKQVPTTELRH